MTIFTRDGLINMLRHNIVTVTFTKVSGEERIMKCTLLSEHIPNALTSNGNIIVNQTKSDTISVWDIDANGWRSFRIAAIKSISMG